MGIELYDLAEANARVFYERNKVAFSRYSVVMLKQIIAEDDSSHGFPIWAAQEELRKRQNAS